MQLTPPQPPQDDDVEALRIGLTGYNVSQAGSQLFELRRERIASFIKDEEGKVHGGIIADIKWAGCTSTGSGSTKASAATAGAAACSAPWSSTPKARASATTIWKPPVFKPSPSIRSRVTRSLASCRYAAGAYQLLSEKAKLIQKGAFPHD